MSGRNILWAAALLACQACGPSVDAPQGPADAVGKGEEPTIALDGSSIVFYNVENLFDTEDDPRINDEDFLPGSRQQWTHERYQMKLEQLSRALSWTDEELPALIGLSEVENEAVVQDLATTGRLKEVGYGVVHFDSPEERGIDVALLLDPRRAAVIHSEKLPIDLGGDRTRDLLYAHLNMAGDTDLHVFVGHWPSSREGQVESEPKRMAVASVLRARADELLRFDPNAHVVIMGDLNDGPTDRSIQEGLRATCTTSATADLFALMCLEDLRAHGSYQYQGEWEYLDQFIVSRAMLARTMVRCPLG
jgi:endonuclease/exonuclease/phosphatase family metal-dependent hydrolase